MLLEVILSNQEGENGEAGPSQTGANQPEETMVQYNVLYKSVKYKFLILLIIYIFECLNR